MIFSANRLNPNLPTDKPQEQSTIKALWRLQKVILSTLDYNQVAKNSVNSVLSELGYLNLGYRIIVLALVNEKKNILERIAISETPDAKRALEITPVPFHEINIPLTDPSNISIKALKTQSITVTNNWCDILCPVYTPDEAQQVQTTLGIKTSMVYPVISQEKAIGILIFSMIKNYQQVSEEEKDILSGFTDLVGLAVQRSVLFTSLQNTTKQLQLANNKLQELDKLKDDFVSVASHELRTPMTAIRSYAWMAIHRSDVPLTQKLNRYLDRILLSTERLINLVNDMLNVSRIESGRVAIKPQAFDLAKLISDVMTEIAPKASEKSIHLKIVSTRLPLVFADPDKVHQVLLNLLGNALKFTPQNGEIIISFLFDGQLVETNIKDSGVGISRDDLSRLFQKFGRIDNSYVASATSGGTGLGLYICKNLIELMKGKIWASSPGLNKGTIFTFSLPFASTQVLNSPDQYTRRVETDAKTLEPVSL